MRFPYQRYTVNPTPSLLNGLVYRPEIPLRVIGAIGDASFLALVDTGADETILPLSIGEALGARMDGGPPAQVAGLGGQAVDVYHGQVELELTAGRKIYRWSAIVGFVEMEPEGASAILGHAGCINFFRLRFDVERGEVQLQPNGTFPGVLA